jgi:hypothetical protein
MPLHQAYLNMAARCISVRPARTQVRAPLNRGRRRLACSLRQRCESIPGARGLERKQEFAVRSALGASRTAILRQLLADSLLTAVSGWVLGAAPSALPDETAACRFCLSQSEIPRLDEAQGSKCLARIRITYRVSGSEIVSKRHARISRSRLAPFLTSMVHRALTAEPSSCWAALRPASYAVSADLYYSIVRKRANRFLKADRRRSSPW